MQQLKRWDCEFASRKGHCYFPSNGSLAAKLMKVAAPISPVLNSFSLPRQDSLRSEIISRFFDPTRWHADKILGGYVCPRREWEIERTDEPSTKRLWMPTRVSDGSLFMPGTI
jgi:hypothetical protein